MEGLLEILESPEFRAMMQNEQNTRDKTAWNVLSNPMYVSYQCPKCHGWVRVDEGCRCEPRGDL